jgi:D-arabinose 1-dehydrogenase-like Zn-dependent alcohol dehydrogenase
MRSVRMVRPGAPLELQDIPVPAIGPRDVLVRIRAAGVCHSDVHYRAGRSAMGHLPITLGHEVAGTIEASGAEVADLRPGDRVCLHYNIVCGECYYCVSGNEQFCTQVKMLGHHVDGGYAEFVAVPARNALILPAEISFEAGATLMCASATALHALRKGRLSGGQTVAVFGIGGLGISAVQLARALGAVDVFAVDIQQEKLRLAERYGALPIDGATSDAVGEIRARTGGQGVDVALELIGLPKTMTQAVDSLAPLGRAVIVGISEHALQLNTYHQLLGKEAEIIGSNDHLAQELPLLLDLARRGVLDTSRVVSRVLPLDAELINQRLDALESFTNDVRAVIVPQENAPGR